MGGRKGVGGTAPSVYSLKGEGVNRTSVAPAVICILRSHSETLVTAEDTIAHNQNAGTRDPCRAHRRRFDSITKAKKSAASTAFESAER